MIKARMAKDAITLGKVLSTAPKMPAAAQGNRGCFPARFT